MEHTINVALVGYGLVGRVFHAPLLSTTLGLRLHTVVSSDPSKVLADYPKVRVVAQPESAFTTPEIQLVVIATPNLTHAPLAMSALTNGKHVVVDKPFTLNVAQAQEVIKAATRANCLLSVFQNRRWDSDFLTLQRLLQENTLGKLAELHSHFDRYRPNVADRWREQPLPGSGLWFDLGPHLVDQALQLFGMPTAIQADLCKQRIDAHVDDYFHVQLRYPQHRVHLHAGSLVVDHRLRFAAHGAEASYIKYGLDTQEAALRQGKMPGTLQWGRDPQCGELHIPTQDGIQIESVDNIPGDYRQYYRAMRDAILHGVPTPVSMQQALEVMSILEWGVQSTRDRREVYCNMVSIDGLHAISDRAPELV